MNISSNEQNSNLAQIGTLWIDGALSWLEIAALTSFVDTGHDIVLYTYGDVPNVPPGVTVEDARKIWNTETITIHTESGSPAPHSDIFRVMMAKQTGRVWVDTDIIALRPFTRDVQWFIGHEREDKLELGNAVFGPPADSALLNDLHTFLIDPKPIPPWLKDKHRDELAARWAADPTQGLGDLPWGTSGPKALTWFAAQTGEITHAHPQTIFFPVSFQDRRMLIDPTRTDELDALLAASQSYAVHLYSRWLRKASGRHDDGYPPKDSWIGRWAATRGIINYATPEIAPEIAPAIIPTADAQPPAGGAHSSEQDIEKAHKKAENNAIEKLALAACEAAIATLPQRKARIPGGENTSRHGRVTIVTMAKDEGPYVLEWVAHHHVLGFTDILAYTNDCSDGTDEMFDALAECGLVTRFDNPHWKDKPPQSRALHWAEVTPYVMGSDWLLVMDLDEFVSIRVGGHHVDDLIDGIVERGATGMCLTWRFFGSAGETAFGDGPVTERLTQAANDRFVKGFGIKTLFKTDPHMALAIHRPYLKIRFVRSDAGKDYPVEWLNGSGQPLDGRDLKWRLNTHQNGYALAQMNHYGVKSREEFLLRRLRGDVLDNHSKYDSEYFGVFDRNEIEDRSALSLKEKRDDLIAQLMQIPRVRAAAELIEARRQAKLARLRNSDGYLDQIDGLVPYSFETAMKIKRN